MWMGATPALSVGAVWGLQIRYLSSSDDVLTGQTLKMRCVDGPSAAQRT